MQRYHYHADMTIPINDGTWVFVFGSNTAGVHGAGAARVAKGFGAEFGRGQGLVGNSYAIPTKNGWFQSLNLEEIEIEVKLFISCAKNHLSKRFWITRIGCGLAGYLDEQIAPMFKGAPLNCSFPANWETFLQDSNVENKF